MRVLLVDHATRLRDKLQSFECYVFGSEPEGLEYDLVILDADIETRSIFSVRRAVDAPTALICKRECGGRIGVDIVVEESDELAYTLQRRLTEWKKDREVAIDLFDDPESDPRMRTLDSKVSDLKRKTRELSQYMVTNARELSTRELALIRQK